MGGAYKARRNIVLASHSPQFLAFGEGHLQPAVAPAIAHLTGTFLGISLILQPQLKEGISGMQTEWSASSTFARRVIRPSRMIAESGRLSQSVRYEGYKTRVEPLCRVLESQSVADDGMFYDSSGDDESDWLPWTVRRIIESGPGSRVDDVQEVP